MTDPTANNKREDALPNVVLEADPTLDKSAEQGVQQNQTPAGTDPSEPKAEEGENSRPVTPDSEKENNKPKRKVYIQEEDNDNESRIRGNVDLEVNFNGDANISVTLNINKCPIQNLRVRRCHYFM